MKQKTDDIKLNIKAMGLRSLTLGMALIGVGGQALAANSYSITTDFNTVGTVGFIPYKIKANNQILGAAATLNIVNNVQVRIPQLYDTTSGSVVNIDNLLNGDTFASSNAINANGQAIGQVLPANSTTGVSPNVFVRNADGSVIDLGMSPGSTAFSAGVGVGINDAGKIFGNKSGTSLCDWRTFVGTVNGGGLTALGSLGGGVYDWTQASAMNASGQIVGRSSPSGACLLSDTWHAFISTPTGLKDLQSSAMPVINPGNGGSTAYDVNDFGFAAGEYPYAFGAATRVFPAGAPIMHAVVWNTNAGTYTDLGKLNFKSSLLGINASGQAVGYEVATTTAATSYAVIGDIASGNLTDLNALVTNLPAGWILGNAFDISDAGEILVSAKDAVNTIHYVLLKPSTTPVITVPAAPTNLSAASISTSQINLTWVDNATNETGQSLERCQGTGCSNFTPIATLAVGATSYSDTALAAGASYSYRVRAQNSTGYSVYSNTATKVTAIAKLAPVAPSNLTALSIARYKVILGWADNASNESGFQIERCKGTACTNFSKIAAVGANVTSYANSNLSRNTSYSYRVRAINSAGKSAYSNILNTKTLP